MFFRFTRYTVLFFTLLAMAVAAMSALAVAEETPRATAENEYRLAVGDEIQVHVLGHDDLTVKVRISDNKTIIYPLLGELAVVDMTRQDVETLIYQSLKGPYLVAPVVSATIISYRQIFLQGEVSNPGPYPYTPGLTLRRSILNAGGFTDMAAKSKIYVVNELQSDNDGKKVGMNYRLKPGDIVTVKASFF